MVLSWSLTEVVRYSFYAFSLLGTEPAPLVFLRYTLFYLLYPTGASSEAFLMYATLPTPVLSLGLQGGVHALVRKVLFVTWWPGTCNLPVCLGLLYSSLRSCSFAGVALNGAGHEGPAWR